MSTATEQPLPLHEWSAAALVGAYRCRALSPVEVADTVRKLTAKLVVVPGDDPLSVEAQRNATVLFTVLLRKHLLRGITFGAVRK